MNKMMILSLIVVLLGVGLVSAQEQDTDSNLAEISAQGYVTVIRVERISLAIYEPVQTLAEIAATGEVNVVFDSADETEDTIYLLAELSAEGYVIIALAPDDAFTCDYSPELREISAQGFVTVSNANLFCLA